MRIAIDLDGTAWSHKPLFISICKGLVSNGHEIGILTAHNKNLTEADLHLWKARGFPPAHFYLCKDDHESSIPTREWKMSMMKKHKIDYLFDDFDSYNNMEIIKL